jgi:hypothetical protein
LAVAVAEAAPFDISLAAQRAPIVRNGATQLQITARRSEGFDKPIRIHMPHKPPGLGAGDVTIEPGQSEALMPVNAAGNAQIGRWKLCVLGHADTDNGRIWASSQLVDLEVAEPYVSGKIELAAAEQGRATPLVCKLEHARPFEGVARAELIGLPPNTTAEPVDVSQGDAQVVFQVTPATGAPLGQHKSLLVRLTVTLDGEPIVHHLAHGGTLRVDPPAAQPAVSASPAPPAEKPLTRLEQLRQQAASTQ